MGGWGGEWGAGELVGVGGFWARFPRVFGGRAGWSERRYWGKVSMSTVRNNGGRG